MADIAIRVLVEDQATGKIKIVERSLYDLNRQSASLDDKGGKNILDFAADIGQLVTGVNQGMQLIATAIGAAKKVIEFSEEGAAMQQLATAGDNLAKSFGMSMDEIVDRVSAASQGLVSEVDIVSSSNRAMLLHVSDNVEDLASLMEIAAFRAQIMGISTTQAFDNIVTGLGRHSIKILDNLGIIIDADDAYAEYADSIGKTVKELTAEEKTKALVNATIEEGNKLMADTGGLLRDNKTIIEQADTAQQNYFNNLKIGMADTVTTFAQLKLLFYNSLPDSELNLLGWLVPENAKDQINKAYETLYWESVATAKGLKPVEGPVELDLFSFGENMPPPEIIEKYGTAIFNVQSAVTGLGLEMPTFNTKVEVTANKIRGMSQEAIELSRSLQEELMKAIVNLGEAYDDFRGGIAGDLVDGLKEAGLSGDDLLSRLELIDQFAGTDYAVQYKIDLALPDLLKTLIENPEQFLEEAQAFTEYFAPLTDSVEKAQLEVDKLQDLLDTLERIYTAKIVIIGGGSVNPGVLDRAAGGVIHAASGIPITAPYLVGELGPEPFFPAVDGRIISHGEAIGALRSGSRGVGAVNVSINTPMNFADKIWVERELVPYIKDAIDQIDRGA